MTQLITNAGTYLTWNVEAQGWRNADADRDAAIDALCDLLRDLPVEQAEALHATLIEWAADLEETGSVDYPEIAQELTARAVHQVTQGWARPCEGILMLSAV